MRFAASRCGCHAGSQLHACAQYHVDTGCAGASCYYSAALLRVVHAASIDCLCSCCYRCILGQGCHSSHSSGTGCTQYASCICCIVQPWAGLQTYYSGNCLGSYVCCCGLQLLVDNGDPAAAVRLLRDPVQLPHAGLLCCLQRQHLPLPDHQH